MRPELVLNEDEKKRRFKKFLRKKEEESSTVNSSPEPRYSDDESLSERVHDMPPLEPIEANQKSPFPFPREIPYPYPFQPTTSSMYNQSMYSAKQMNASQDWVRQNAQKNKSYIRPETDFLSELRSEVKNYVENNQYEHKISRTSSFPTPNNCSTSSKVFSIPPHSKVQGKPVFNSCMPSPPSSPEAQLPMVFSNAMKDVEAWRYFANRGFLTQNIFPQTTLTSPDRLRNFLVAPDKTKLYVKPNHLPVPSYPVKNEFVPQQEHHLVGDQRPSVITNYSSNGDRILSSYRDDTSFKIKLEKMDEEFDEEEEYTDKNLETTPVSSTKVYLPENLSIPKDVGSKEQSHEHDDLIFKYVHKKFRTHVENSEGSESSEKNEDSLADTFPQKRKSVIFHASSSKKICAE